MSSQFRHVKFVQYHIVFDVTSFDDVVERLIDCLNKQSPSNALYLETSIVKIRVDVYTLTSSRNCLLLSEPFRLLKPLLSQQYCLLSALLL